MTDEEILKHVDHTLLKPFSVWEDYKKLCDDAIEYKTASVCVPPCFVKHIREEYGDALKICTVIGFPLGYSVTEVKAFEAKKAIVDGADEIDMVINVSDAKAGNFETIEKEIKTLRKATEGKILKVIIETCYLTVDEKIKLCKCVTNAKADYIKTSTGFGTGGAAFDDVKLFKEHIGPNVKIKAAGGIRSREDMEKFLMLGADRLGTSSAVSILRNQV
jgi:deoxyribose-phosphate aldolase